MTKIILFFFILLIVFSNCKKNDSKTIDDKSEVVEKTDKLQFVNYFNNSFYNIAKEQGVSNAKEIPIISGRLYKIRQHCLHGIGICDVTFFGIWTVSFVDNNSNGREIYAPVFFNESHTGGFLRFFLSTNPNEISENDLTFIVDDDFYIQVTDYNNITSLKIAAGSYSYNPELGTYGGYEIPFVAIY